MIWPPTMRPGFGTMRRMDCAVTVLPQPDSPTTPSVRPRASEYVKPSTARTVPSSSTKWTRRSRTSSKTSSLDRVWSGAGEAMTTLPAAVWIGRVAQSVAQEIEGHDGHDQWQRGQHQPRRQRDGLDVLRILEQHAPRDGRLAQAEAQERQCRLTQNGRRDGQCGMGDDVRHERRQHVAEDDPPLARPAQPRGEHEIFLTQR